jgi:hypothetical protein
MTSWVYGDLVVDALRELANEDVRARLWLSDGSDGEVSSFDECVCRLFDDSGLGDALDKGDVAFYPDVDAALRDLRKALRRVDAHQRPQEIIRDPLILQAEAQSQRILELLPGAHQSLHQTQGGSPACAADAGRIPNPTRSAPEVPDRARHRTFTAQYKLDILTAYDAAPAGDKGTLLRRVQDGCLNDTAVVGG